MIFKSLWRHGGRGGPLDLAFINSRDGVFESAVESKARNLLTRFAPNCTLQPTAAIKAEHVISEMEIETAASHTHPYL